jgi:ribose 5-phosphate isomerase B
MKKIYLGADHAGFKLKETVKNYLDSLKIPYEDMGNLKYNKDDDYPDFGYKVAKAVAKNNGLGILICGSSIGVCIVANKVKGVRGAPVVNTRDAELSREHTNANVLCLSGWNTSAMQAKKIIRAWLKTAFSQAERHSRRVDKIKEIEEKEFK